MTEEIGRLLSYSFVFPVSTLTNKMMRCSQLRQMEAHGANEGMSNMFTRVEENVEVRNGFVKEIPNITNIPCLHPGAGFSEIPSFRLCM